MCKLIWTLMNVICYITFSLSIEVNKENCKNNKVLLAPCKFTINIVPPLDSDLICQLRFTSLNSTSVSFVNNRTSSMPPIESKCPTIEFNIHNGTDNKISVNCGSSLNPFYKNYTNFIYGHFAYKNSGFTDSETNIIMELGMEKCDSAPAPPSSNKTIIWILIACAVVLIIIIIIIIAIDCNRKVPPKKPNAQLLVNEGVDKKKNINVNETEKVNFPQESKPMIAETNA